METKPRVLLTGASGMVGGFIGKYLGSTDLLTPSSQLLNISSRTSVTEYVTAHAPQIIIHAAAFTDNDAAERERGKKEGLCWQVNAEGTRYIAEAAAASGAFVIFISTGSVFAGDAGNPGPFTETDPASPEDKLSWYGWTKAVGESFVKNGAVVRLSRPVADTPIVNEKRTDYIHHLVSLYDPNRLYPLFTDQAFPVTYLPDVVVAVKQLIASRTPGIFHIVSTDRTTPYELAMYAIEKARYVRPSLSPTTFDDFIAVQKLPRRFTKYSALDGTATRAELHIPARTWKEIVDCLYPSR